MNLIYVTNRNAYSTEQLIKKIAAEQWNIPSPVLLRNEHGKPYFQDNHLQGMPHFSVAHTKDKLFAVFSKAPIGLDAECKHRKVDYQRLLRRVDATFPVENHLDFLKLWTAKESVVKYLGKSIAANAKDVSFTPTFQNVCFDNELLPVTLTQLCYQDILICVCSEEQSVFSICELS